MKRISCIFLALLMLAGTALAEGGAETETSAVETENTVEETAVEAADAEAPDQMEILTGTPDLTELEPVEGTDTTYLVVETAGMQETVAQSVFTQKQLGFSFQYDSEYLSVYDTVSEDGKTGAVYVNPSDPENVSLIS
ncbi:MAG: hypothetical protein IJ174_05530, partial [Clostridia bacterium]|nr:hypothetical protein [Clostridia bacterium]